jgi:heme-degrading monooxygenase HmoA
MILYVQKFNVLPGKFETYAEFAKSFMAKLMGAGGLEGVDAYFPLSGSHQRVVVYRFADLATWATWREHEDVRNAFEQMRDYVSDRSEEVWSPPPA